MKAINKDRLLKLIDNIFDSDTDVFIDQINHLMCNYGDDWYINDGVFGKCSEGLQHKSELK